MLLREPRLVWQTKRELLWLLGDSLVEAELGFLTSCRGVRVCSEQSKASVCFRELNWLSDGVNANSGLEKGLLVLCSLCGDSVL